MENYTQNFTNKVSLHPQQNNLKYSKAISLEPQSSKTLVYPLCQNLYFNVKS